MTKALIPHPLISPALKICERIDGISDQRLAHEVLVLDGQTLGIVVDVDGVDFILSMMRLPIQRPRPTDQ